MSGGNCSLCEQAVHVNTWTEGETILLQCDRCGAVEVHPKEAMPRISRELYGALLSLEAPLRVAAGLLMEPWLPSEGPGMRKDMQEAIVEQIGEHLARLSACRRHDAGEPVVTISDAPEGGRFVSHILGEMWPGRRRRLPLPEPEREGGLDGDLLGLRAVMEAEIRKLTEAKDGAYSERDQCVALFARMAYALGYPVGLGEYDPNDTLWEKDWRTIVFVELPTGQLSWHIHDSERVLFEWMPVYLGVWDGHSTPEKYDRMARYHDAAALRVVERAALEREQDHGGGSAPEPQYLRRHEEDGRMTSTQGPSTFTIRKGQRWRERGATADFRVVGYHGHAVMLSGPGPCRGLTYLEAGHMLSEWELVPGETDPDAEHAALMEVERAARQEACRHCAQGTPATDVHSGQPAEYHGYAYNPCEAPKTREALARLDRVRSPSARETDVAP